MQAHHSQYLGGDFVEVASFHSSRRGQGERVPNSLETRIQSRSSRFLLRPGASATRNKALCIWLGGEIVTRIFGSRMQPLARRVTEVAALAAGARTSLHFRHSSPPFFS